MKAIEAFVAREGEGRTPARHGRRFRGPDCLMVLTSYGAFLGLAALAAMLPADLAERLASHDLVLAAAAPISALQEPASRLGELGAEHPSAYLAHMVLSYTLVPFWACSLILLCMPQRWSERDHWARFDPEDFRRFAGGKTLAAMWFLGLIAGYSLFNSLISFEDFETRRHVWPATAGGLSVRAGVAVMFVTLLLTYAVMRRLRPPDMRAWRGVSPIAPTTEAGKIRSAM